jgi:L,D-transpeptidase YcbB
MNSCWNKPAYGEERLRLSKTCLEPRHFHRDAISTVSMAPQDKRSHPNLRLIFGSIAASIAVASPVFAAPPPPVSILPPSMSAPTAPPTVLQKPLPATKGPVPVVIPPSISVPQPTVILPPVLPPAIPVLQHWTKGDAQSLLVSIQAIGTRGLNSADYLPDALQAAITVGEGPALDLAAKASFDALVADVRDGHTPQAARIQWLVKDTDAVTFPSDQLMQQALLTHNVETVLASIDPEEPEYAALRDALTATPVANIAQRKLIRANMDRWRWLPRSLGDKHVIANVPEYMLRVMKNGRIVSSYPVIVGKLATQTPNLMANAVGIVVHPPWVIPRSLIKEEVGPMIARSPAAARARGYTWTGSGPTLSVTQQAGPHSALGFMKVDMPNPDAIFVHDTPNRTLFTRHPRAFSHGCLRTDRALELGIVLGLLQGGGDIETLKTLIKAGKTQRVPFKETIPVVIAYFTFARGADGKLQNFTDLYGRDGPVIAALDRPRVPVLVKPPVVPAMPVLPTVNVTTG